MTRPTNLHRTKHQAGFTLVELTIAVAFLSFILIFVLFAITQVMSNYNKGATIKEINQLARDATDIMARDIRNTDIGSINTSALSHHRVCFGDISYVWNEKDGTENKYTDGVPLHFTRVRNPGGSMCIADSGGVYPDVPVGTSVAGAENALIPAYDDLRIWVNTISIQANTTLELVTINIVLTTTSDNQPVDGPGGPSCSGDRAGAYCAVGSFQTTVTTRNGGE